MLYPGVEMTHLMTERFAHFRVCAVRFVGRCWAYGIFSRDKSGSSTQALSSSGGHQLFYLAAFDLNTYLGSNQHSIVRGMVTALAGPLGNHPLPSLTPSEVSGLM